MGCWLYPTGSWKIRTVALGEESVSGKRHLGVIHMEVIVEAVGGSGGMAKEWPVLLRIISIVGSNLR